MNDDKTYLYLTTWCPTTLLKLLVEHKGRDAQIRISQTDAPVSLTRDTVNW